MSEYNYYGTKLTIDRSMLAPEGFSRLRAIDTADNSSSYEVSNTQLFISENSDYIIEVVYGYKDCDAYAILGKLKPEREQCYSFFAPELDTARNSSHWVSDKFYAPKGCKAWDIEFKVAYDKWIKELKIL